MRRMLYVSTGVRSPKLSFSVNFFRALRNAGHDVTNIVLQLYISDFHGNDIEKNKLFKLRAITFKMSDLPQDYDIYFVDGVKQILINDLPNDKLVIYYHKDLFSTFYVFKPDIILYRFCATHLILMRIFYPLIYRSVLKRYPFFFAIDPNHFKVVNKDIKGVSYLGPRFDVVERQEHNFIQQVSYNSHARVVKFLRKNKISGFFREVCSNRFYTGTVGRLQARIIIPADYSYETRVLYESAYMGTVMILYIQNRDAEKVFAKNFHFRRNIEYIGFTEPEELIDICKNLESYNLKKMVRNARKVVDMYHTFDKRVEQLSQIIEDHYK